MSKGNSIDTTIADVNDDPVYSLAGAARYMGLTPGTLRAWAARGIGPRSAKLGTGRTSRRVYRRSWIDTYLEGCIDVGVGTNRGEAA